jgi:hypothetical protein
MVFIFIKPKNKAQLFQLVVADTTMLGQHPDIKNILDKTQEVFKNSKLVDGGLYQDNKSYITWQIDDGWNIADTSAASISSYYLCKTDTFERPFKKTMPPIYSSLAKMFTDNGFTKNTLNSDSNYDDNDTAYMGYYYGLAFEKGDLKCLVVGIPDCRGLPGGYGEKYGSSIEVVCTNSLDKNKLWQLPLLKALNLKNSAINDIHIFGDYFYLTLQHDSLIVKKEKDGSYTQIYKGQDNPSCGTRDEYDFPKELSLFLEEQCMGDIPNFPK